MSLEIVQMPLSALREYAGNAKIHDEANVEAIRASIRRFGNCDPIGVWTNPQGEVEIVEGHGRKLALEAEGYEVADVIFLDHLTDEERRAYALAHNQTTLMSDFDLDILEAELDLLADFDMGDFGFESEDGAGGFFDQSHRFDGDYSAEGESGEYAEFVGKFEPKRTTDDCYTPDNVYEAVASYVAETFGVDRSKFVRPFYPGGDYQSERYPEDCVVVDNPPFSILAEIKRYYAERGIRYFLFAPTLTLFSGRTDGECSVCVGVGVTYDNGANVSTSFVTNLDDAAVITAPALYEAVSAANDENERALRTELPKYNYPDEVITAAIAARWCKHGIDYRLDPTDCVKITALDAQKEAGKAVFGGGFLLSERAATERASAEQIAVERAAAETERAIVAAAERLAAERAAATRWQLSDREREIVARLGNAAESKTA